MTCGWVKKKRKNTGFSPWFHLSGFHFGYPQPYGRGCQHQWDTILVGEFTTHFRTYFSGWIESDVHWGYGVLTHSHILNTSNPGLADFPGAPAKVDDLKKACCGPIGRLIEKQRT